MIDIHSHIIFNVDDGPSTLSDSLLLIEEAYKQGVNTIVATSHRRKGMFETSEEDILKNFEILKKEVNKNFKDLIILYGSEIYYTSSILEKLKMKKIPTLNGTRFVLIEFSENVSWEYMKQGLYNIQIIGYTPILAHIERYKELEYNESRVQELINKGCYMQVNSASILKSKFLFDSDKIYKKRGKYFLKKNLIHFISSDMHNLSKRPPKMKIAYDFVEKQYGKDYARAIFFDNAKKILANKFI